MIFAYPHLSGDGPWTCKLCGKVDRTRLGVWIHTYLGWNWRTPKNAKCRRWL